MKDWVGNKKSTFVTLGASSHSDRERHPEDYYATDPNTIDPLFESEDFSDTIWESACGEGHLSKRMEELGKSVFSTDIIDRGYGHGVFDFLHDKLEKWEGDIITNPPYKFAQEFVEKSLEYLQPERKLAMFLKITFLEGKKRRKLFDKSPPARVYVFTARQAVAINGDPEMFAKSSAACYAWFVWVKGTKEQPTIHWI